MGTWNVNGKFPREDLTPWLAEGAYDLGQGGPGGQGRPKINMPDVYVLGLQEMVDLTATNVALGTQSDKRSKQWLATFEQQLNAAAGAVYGPASSLPGGPMEFVCVGSRYLVGVSIAVYVQARWRRFVGEVADAVAPVGVMGVMGNKGGASVRLRIADSTLCFVCAHLAAHRGAVADRKSVV